MAVINLSSPPSNTWGLVQYLAQRIPGYDYSEYLRELNSAYVHVWEEVTKLKNHYFTNQVTVTVQKAQQNFDLLFNSDGALSNAVSNRLYQITRVRVQPPAGGLFQTTIATHFNDPDALAIEANPNSNPTPSGPYYWYLYGRGNLRFTLPLQVGTTIEFTYTFWPIALGYQTAGTVSSSGLNVAGSSTTFTSLVQPDFKSALPFLGTPNVPISPSTLLLQDSNGIQWSVTVSNVGLLQTTSNGAGAGQNIILNDQTNNSTSWKLGITTGGALTTTSQTYSATNQLFVELQSANNFLWLLGVTNAGVLTTSSAPVSPQEQIQAELVCNANQIYRVSSVLNDTNLVTATQISPALSGSIYVLATLPEIPREHIRVIASIAMAKMYSVAGDDARVTEWTATSQNNLQMMKDALVERQSQQPPRKQRFPYGVGRKNRAFLR